MPVRFCKGTFRGVEAARSTAVTTLSRVKSIHPRRTGAPRALIAVVALACAVAACGGNSSDGVAGVVTFADNGVGNDDVRGAPLPIVDVGDRDGNVVSSASFVGEPLVVNFWVSTCPPCARELPDFAEVHAELGDEVRFIGINPEDSVQAMERFAGERGVEYELFLDDTREFTDAIGAAAFPITLFVTPEGGIVSQTGAIDADELRTEIAQLLEEGA